MTKKTLLWFAKCFAAGCAALVIASLFSMIYYNTGRHSHNPSGATDYVWESGRMYIQLREGLGFGFNDEYGFNNSYPGVTSDADVLIIGSSHMEAAQVAQNKTAVYRLNALFDEADSRLSAYNIGVSAHNLYRCAANLPAALEYYRPEYAVMEIDSIQFVDASAQQMLDGTLEEVTSYEGLLYDIQAVPLPKLIKQQLREYQWGQLRSGKLSGWESFVRLMDSCGGQDTPPVQTAPPAAQETPLEERPIWKMFEQMSAAAQQYGTTLIVVYHPTLSISADGSAYVNANMTERGELASLCTGNGIEYIDLSEVFLESYANEHKLPHGFVNSEIGAGHLNAHGHNLMAQEIYRLINRLEEVQ